MTDVHQGKRLWLSLWNFRIHRIIKNPTELGLFSYFTDEELQLRKVE